MIQKSKDGMGGALPHTPKTNELDEILSDFLDNTAEAIEEVDFHRRNAAVDEAIKECTQSLKQLFLDIVETDEKVADYDKEADAFERAESMEIVHRNAFRGELRKKVEEL